MPLTDHIRPEPNPPLTRERVETARQMYAEGFTASRICSHCLISLGTLYKCLDGTPFGADGPRFDPIPRRRNILGQRTRALRVDPVSLRNRLIRTAERQVREIELRLSQPGRAGPERERDVRMLGMTVKNLRELARLDIAESRDTPRAENPCMPTPDQINDLRRSLVERIEALVESRTAADEGRAVG